MDRVLMQAMHQSLSLAALGPEVGRSLRWRASEAGSLIVHDSPLWITRTGGGEDWVLAPGERLPLRAGEEVVAETWQPCARAELHWQPEAQALRGRGVWELLARGAERGARALGRVADWARARSAAASASPQRSAASPSGGPPSRRAWRGLATWGGTSASLFSVM